MAHSRAKTLCDAYFCPAGKMLTPLPRQQIRLRRLSPQTRAAAPRSRPASTRALATWPATSAKTDAYRTSRRQRKKVEMLFAHLTRILRLDRLPPARTMRRSRRVPPRRHRPEPPETGEAHSRNGRHGHLSGYRRAAALHLGSRTEPQAATSSSPALVNLRGQLIGINTAIFSPAGGNIGIGFAVPINMARRVMEQIVQHGSVRRGRIGLSIRDITPADGASAATSDQGAVIGNISRGSPAEQGGLQNGDIVVSADGTPISSAARLRNKLGLTPIGEHVQLTVRRSGVTRNFIVRVAPDSRDSREPAPTQTRGRAAFRGSQP
jgi:hypothetical protein